MSSTTTPAPARSVLGALPEVPEVDLSSVPDRAALNGPEDELITAALAYALAHAAGIRAITTENAAEVYARVRMLERLGGPMLLAEGEQGRLIWRDITPTDVRRRIGMCVAGGKSITRERFLRHVSEGYLDDFMREYALPTKRPH